MNGRLVIFALCITLLTSPLIWGMEETAFRVQIEGPRDAEGELEKFSFSDTSLKRLKEEYTSGPPYSLKLNATIAAIKHIYTQIKQKKFQKFLEDQATIALKDESFGPYFERHITNHITRCGVNVSDFGGKVPVLLAHIKTLNLVDAILRGIFKMPNELVNYVRAVHLLKNEDIPHHKDYYGYVLLGGDELLGLDFSVMMSPFWRT